MQNVYLYKYISSDTAKRNWSREDMGLVEESFSPKINLPKQIYLTRTNQMNCLTRYQRKITIKCPFIILHFIMHIKAESLDSEKRNVVSELATHDMVVKNCSLPLKFSRADPLWKCLSLSGVMISPPAELTTPLPETSSNFLRIKLEQKTVWIMLKKVETFMFLYYELTMHIKSLNKHYY